MSVISTSKQILRSTVPGKVVMSGIQPTGVFHLGNLLGAVNLWRSVLDYTPKEAIYMVADLHSLTILKDSETLNKLRWNALASLIACGLDPQKCNLYFQSHVPEHTQLHWVFSNISSMGYLNRMTQWKSKARLDSKASIKSIGNIGDVNLGLFSYPVLQAADVLVNKAELVPIGEDQKQHLELTRHIANSFNFKFGHTFDMPTTVLTECKRVLSLRDFKKKMSKSDEDQLSCIYITDTSDEIKTKLQKAITDDIQGDITFDPENRPAVSNLIMLASGMLNLEPIEFLNKFKPNSHMQLKEVVRDVLVETLNPISSEYFRLQNDRAYLESVAREGALVARERTGRVYDDVRKRVGL